MTVSDVNGDKNPHDIPFDEACVKAQCLILLGATIHQKFWCENCKVRQTIPTPNVFYAKGQCEECNHISDLQKNGCGFMLMIGRGVQDG